MARKERPPKIYQVINRHPTYATPEEKEEARCKLAYELAMVFHRAMLEGRYHPKAEN